MTRPHDTVDYQGDRYIALIDILGFRSLVNTSPLAEVVRKVEGLLADVQGRPKAVSHSPDGQERIRTLGEMHFSDTVLIWTPLVKDKELGYIAGGHLFFTVTELIYKSFIAGIPLRAGIGFGQSFIDSRRHIFVGPAIVDAYETESAQDWIGGALHPSVPWGIPYMSTLIEYPVPTKAGAAITPQIALNWPDCPSSPEEYKLLKHTLDQTLGADAPSLVRTKFDNTLRFTSTVLSKVRLRRVSSEGVSDWFNPLDD